MTISHNWLKEYIDLPESPEEIANTLTSTGLEVESIKQFETVKGGLKGLVIGIVRTCAKHPNADKLSLTSVDVGKERLLKIVCGAPNVAAGQKVIVAVPGTTVHPVKGEPFTIQLTKIRGEESEGMICAADEIGLGEDHSGILVLDTTLPPGSLVADYYKVNTDTVFEIGLTPNRADAASHIGVARDLRAAKNRDLRWPSVEAFHPDNKSLQIEVSVENTKACPRYSGVTMVGLAVGESPDWLKQRLRSIGLTPINNLVDITNFVCHETGQPLHAFDAAKIKGKKIVVKTQPAGTKFTTLDNKERTLTAGDLMICSASDGMCIAGVFGGIESGITSQTTSIFLESACFAPESIRKTSMHHQLATDASFRFSRGTDPSGTVYALKRAALLMKDIAGGTISSDVVDVYPKRIEKRKIVVKDKNMNRLIGKVIPREVIFSILGALEIEVVEKLDDRYTVVVPTYRVEVLQEADIVEEVLRVYGFNNVELSEITGTSYLALFPEKDLDKLRKSVGEMIVANGFHEIFTNSLTSAGIQKKHGLSFQGTPVEILNKLSEELGIMRQTMLFTGLEAVAYNLNRKQKEIKFYEFGKIYWAEGGQYKEQERLVLLIAGGFESGNWQNKARAVGYHDIAQIVAQILEKCAARRVVHQNIDDQLLEYGHRVLVGDEEVGKIGKVKSSLTKDLGIKEEVFYADMDAALLFKSASPKFDVQAVPKFPEVKRDLSLVLDKRITFEVIRQVVATTEKKLVKEVTAFDVYTGSNIPEGKKAYALGFTLLDETKTLTDEEIDKTMNKLMAEFEKKLGAVIRK